MLVARTMRLLLSCSLLFAVSATACVGDDKPEEEDLDGLDDSKADSHRRPTNHGDILFGIPEHSVLTETERFHAWTFSLSGDARVDMTTSYSLLGQRRTDTVLYLYKEGPTGWGAYIARNDDYGSTTYSQLVRTLGAGHYRVLVKGHLATTLGKFKVTVGCEGDGCAPPAIASCVFGEVYHDIFENNPYLEVINRTKIYPSTLDTLNPEDRQRLMVAVQQSSHTDVTTPEEAIERVDQGEVNVSWLYEPAAKRSFIAFEYGAGDNSYGAVFDRHSGDLVTPIHDGDMYCDYGPETCLLSDDWSALKTDPRFEVVSTRTVRDAGELTGITADQALIAFGQSFDDVTSVADGLSRVDGGEVDVVALRHRATGTSLDVVAYHAGDTSVGRIYYQGTTDRAGIINDLYIEGCTLFE